MPWLTQGIGAPSPLMPKLGAAAAPATPVVGGTAADTGLLRNITADILGLQSKAEIANANADASDIQATGFQQESAAYQTVADIAGENANVAGIAGDIKALQERRALTSALGRQRTDVASAGFADSGSSIDLMRASVAQGALTRQLNTINTSLTKGGYLQEGAAAGAEVAGATMAGNAATALAAKQRASGELATANAASQTQALQDYITATQNGQPLTPEQQLVLSTLGGQPGQPATFSLPAITQPAPVTDFVPTRSAFSGFGSGGNFGNATVVVKR
jgi:hypothetical protein